MRRFASFVNCFLQNCNIRAVEKQISIFDMYIPCEASSWTLLHQNRKLSSRISLQNRLFCLSACADYQPCNVKICYSPEFVTSFQWFRVGWSLIFCICFVDRCLFFWPFSLWPLCCHVSLRFMASDSPFASSFFS